MKSHRNISLAGILIGGLMLLSPYFGLRFAWDHSAAFFNVALASDPAVLSSTNNIVVGTFIAGLLGLAMLTLSLVSYLRGAQHRMHIPGANHARLR